MLDLNLIEIVIVLATLFIAIGILILKGSYIIDEDEIGIVRKNFSILPSKSVLPSGKEISYRGEAGFQAKVLTPGRKWKMPLMFSVFKEKKINIKPGEIGLIHAKYGITKDPGTNFPPKVECGNFEDAEAFLKGHGCKGIQLDILLPGLWNINTKLFKVITKANANSEGILPELLKDIIIESGYIGIVTTQDGKPLDGLNAGPIVDGHSKFRRPDIFLKNGGYMGLQEEFLEEGTYSLNPLFIKIKIVPVTDIEAATVGVILCNIGKIPEKISSDGLVEDGFRGIKRNVLREGKYKINTDINEVFIVPIQDITLEWNDNEKIDKGRYDAGLTSIVLDSKETFLIKLHLTQTIRIKEESAPLLIKRMGGSHVEINQYFDKNEIDHSIPSTKKRYGTIKQFIYKFLVNIVTSTFQKISAKYKGMDFSEHRSEIQSHAAELIEKELLFFGVDSVSTVINYIQMPPDLSEVIKIKQKLIFLTETHELEQKSKLQELAIAQITKKIKIELAEAEGDAIIKKYGSMEIFLRYISIKSLEKIQLPLYYVQGSNSNSSIEPMIIEQVMQKLKEQTININPTTYNQNLTISEEDAKKKIIENTDSNDKKET